MNSTMFARILGLAALFSRTTSSALGYNEKPSVVTVVGNSSDKPSTIYTRVYEKKRGFDADYVGLVLYCSGNILNSCYVY